MRQLGGWVLVSLAAVFTAPGAVAEGPADCQYVQVVDQCRKSLLVLDVGGDEILGRVALDEGAAGQFMPGGVDYASVPGYDDIYSFVAQGPFLHVVDLTRPSPWRTFDVAFDGGLPGIVLSRVHAADPVVVDSQPRYPLYAIGSLAGEPWLVLLDQEALLAEPLDPAAVLLSAGPIRQAGAGVGLDVAAGWPSAGGAIQEAYASVLDQPDGDYRLRFYRIPVGEDFSFEGFLDPWNDEGLPFDGSALRTNGLDYDGSGTQPFGVFQTSRVARNLSSGESSCTLAGDPTDVAVWGPGSAMEHADFLFVTSRNESGGDLLIGFPALECPDGNPASLTVALDGLPRALALSSVTSDTPWIYTANRYESITAVHLQLSSSSADGDRIDLLESFDVTVEGGCPYAVAIRDESFYECADFSSGNQEAKPPKVDCEADPEDPRCVKDLTQKGSGVEGE